MTEFCIRDTTVTPAVWRRAGFQQPEDPDPPAQPLTDLTFADLIGAEEQTDKRLPNSLNIPCFSFVHGHPAQTGRAAWQSSINSMVTANLADTQKPRMGFLTWLIIKDSTVAVQGEEFNNPANPSKSIMHGGLDTQYRWYANKIWDNYGPLVGTIHPITGVARTMSDMFCINLAHEVGVGGSACTVRPHPNPADKLTASPVNCADAIRHALEIMYDEVPQLRTHPNRPIHLWNQSANSGADELMIDAYPGDDYVDCIGLDVYDSAGQPETPGSLAYRTKSVDQIFNQRRLGIRNWMVPFADAVPTHPDVVRCNASSHPGKADEHGGNRQHKSMMFIEIACSAGDTNRNGIWPDGSDHGGGDNPLFVNELAEFVREEQTKTMFGKQLLLKSRVIAWVYFDIDTPEPRSCRITFNGGFKGGTNPHVPKPNARAALTARIAEDV